jgi:hypothetical protein
MSKRLTIYVPNDVAERLGREANASAYLTQAARRLMAVEATRAGLAASGHGEIPQDAIDEQVQAIAHQQRRRDDPELTARMQDRLAEFRRPAP